MNRILFICMGNICRSPTAEGVFRHHVEKHGLSDHFEIDSAGTGAWHVGSAPDSRAQQAARARGIDLSGLRARKVETQDLEYYDLVIAMDRDNQERLHGMASDQQQHKVKLLLEYSDNPAEIEVPDPYYGGEHGFDLVLDLVEEACARLLETLRPR
jgi:protein-tyrosine phosphatase